MCLSAENSQQLLALSVRLDDLITYKYVCPWRLINTHGFISCRNDSYANWDFSDTVYQCTILSFTRNKVVDFVLPPTTNRNDTLEDKQRDNNVHMKTQHSNLTRERCRKGTELRALWTAGVSHLRAGIGS